MTPDQPTPATGRVAELAPDRWAWRLGLMVFGVGLLWRVVRYSMQFPLWGDELAVATNLLDADYYSLIFRLENCQIAPLFFLWGELASLQFFGGGELSMRLIPFLAGCGSLFLAWGLFRLLLSPRPRLLAFGMLAVSTWPVTMTECLKPYSLDLFMSLALSLVAVLWYRDRGRLRYLITLTALVPVALLSSYPVVFVAGGVSLFAAAQFRRLRPWAWFWLGAYNLALLVGFLTAYQVGQNHLATPLGDATTSKGMADFWAEGFPPRSVSGAPLWLLDIHLGTSMSYPFGRVDGTGVLTASLCLVGVLAWRRFRRPAWALLLLGPFLLHLIAASLRRYPYGTEARLMQHLVPPLCLAAGLGLAWLVERSRSEAVRRRATTLIACGLVLFGLGNVVRELVRTPLHSEGTWSRRVMDQLEMRLEPGDVVVVAGRPRDLFLFRWLLETRHPEALWSPDAAALARVPPGTTIWVWVPDAQETLPTRLTEEMDRAGGSWDIIERVPLDFRLQTDPPDPVHFVRLRRG